MNSQSRFRKNQCLPLSILNLPMKGSLLEITSQCSEYNLFYESDKKVQIEAYKISVQKTKLFPNLEIYQWRRQTEFPISKTLYVNIKQSNYHESETVELLVYIQHCPWQLTSFKILSLPQALYILKESLMGFERLLKKFGAFNINEDMIKINEKGFCRVWMNANFANNSFSKPTNSEEQMVKSIRQILQKYCQNCKTSQKLFAILGQEKSFLMCLKVIDNFVVSSKISVPHRFTPQNFCDGIPARILPKKPSKYQLESPKKYRASMLEVMCAKDSVSLQKMKKNNQEAQIKKIMSAQNFICFQPNNMKKSDSETTHAHSTKQTKGSNISPHSNRSNNNKSSREMQEKNHLAMQDRKWLDQNSICSFGVDSETQHKNPKKQKKDLYYSQAAINPEEGKNKASFTSFASKEPVYTLENSFLKKISKANSYAEEFNLVLEDSQRFFESPSNSQVRHTRNEPQVEKLRESHTSNVMKNNGWKSFTGLLQEQKQLNESFHEGQDENAYISDIKLQMLDKIGRRAQAMSILPEEFQELI